MIGNSAGIAMPFLYSAKASPKYYAGYGVSIASVSRFVSLRLCQFTTGESTRGGLRAKRIGNWRGRPRSRFWSWGIAVRGIFTRLECWIMVVP